MALEAQVSFENLISKLDSDELPKRKRLESKRYYLEVRAREVALRYDDECFEAGPGAVHKIETVIYPWWREFKSSQTFTQMVNLFEGESFDLTLSDEISYFWPQRALRELKCGKEGFIEDAKRLQKIGEQRGRGVLISVETLVNSWLDDYWTARVYFSGIGEKFHQLYLQPWSSQRNSWAFALSAQELRIGIDPAGEGNLADKINPKVWLGFAEQIESGRVWRILERSVRDKLKGDE